MLGAEKKGEEVGCRGFALPLLQERFTGLTASLILGGAWAGRHPASATIPGLEAFWSGFSAFLFFVVAETLVLTWLWNHTRGSVLLMWILHAMVNASLSLFFVGDQVQQWWFAGGALGVVGSVVTPRAGADLARRTPGRLAPSPTL